MFYFDKISEKFYNFISQKKIQHKPGTEEMIRLKRLNYQYIFPIAKLKLQTASK